MSKDVRIRCQRGWIGYPGSTVQQSYAEDLVHGFLLWDIDDRDYFDVEFCELPNAQPFITIEWSGTVERTVEGARRYPSNARFRVRSKDLLSQKDVIELTGRLRSELHALEVTFKNDHRIDRSVISAGAATLAKEDLHNPEVLMRLLKDYYADDDVSDDEWDAMKEGVSSYLREALDSDTLVRNTKWSLRDLKFDNTFTYGEGNMINFEQLHGIVGIFGPNRSGKSSIVGTLMYALFNTTDRGNVKNLHVINARRPYCKTKAIINVNGSNYVIERQTVKHEAHRGSRAGQTHASTQLNVFKIDDTGTAIDLVGDQRFDTEKVIRQLIGTADDCLLTSVAAQDEVKLFINQGTPKRRKDLSRFLDLDVFDRMYELANNDVKANRGALKALPDRDWDSKDVLHVKRLTELEALIDEKAQQKADVDQRLHDVRAQLAAFKDFSPVTPTQVAAQESTVSSLRSRLDAANRRHTSLVNEVERLAGKVDSIEGVALENDLADLRKRLDSFKTLESTFESLKMTYEAESGDLKRQERSLKILDDVPCGDAYPTCKFIKDAFKVKGTVENQRVRVNSALEKVSIAQGTLAVLRKEDIAGKVDKIEKLIDLKSKLIVSISAQNVEIVKCDALIGEITTLLDAAVKRLDGLNEALKNEENAEVVMLRNELNALQQSAKGLDVARLALASEVGRVQSDHAKVLADKAQRQELLRLLKAHELVSNAFSRKGIPSLIVASQLPIINAEIAKILSGIVNFSIELEQDDESDSMEIYIDYGDSRRIIEICSGMEKMIAAVAIRVALINVSSLPKTDMFILDEAFGPLDPESVAACNGLLVSLKRYFKTILVITHVEAVKDVADHVIEVSKIEKDARVMYNESWPGDRTSKTG